MNKIRAKLAEYCLILATLIVAKGTKEHEALKLAVLVYIQKSEQ